MPLQELPLVALQSQEKIAFKISGLLLHSGAWVVVFNYQTTATSPSRFLGFGFLLRVSVYIFSDYLKNIQE